MLALTAAERRTAGQLLTAFFDAYEESLSAAPIVPNLDRPALESLSVPDTGLGVDGFFRFVSETLLPNSTTIAHPRFLAYVLGSPTGVLLTFGVATFRTALDNCLEVGPTTKPSSTRWRRTGRRCWDRPQWTAGRRSGRASPTTGRPGPMWT